MEYLESKHASVPAQWNFFNKYIPVEDDGALSTLLSTFHTAYIFGNNLLK